MMTDTQLRFLACLRAALHAQPYSAQLSESDWEALFTMANRQSLLPLFCEAVYATPAAQTYPELFARYRQLTTALVIRQVQHTIDFRALYRDLRAQGLRPVVVKGQLCSALYPLADHRVSADDDLYIPAAELPACHTALVRAGLQTGEPEPRIADEDEITYHDPQHRLYIELHRNLFSTTECAVKDLNAFFRDAFVQAVDMDGLLAMPPHMHLLYLLMHAYKHFVYSGVGIRQTCDIGLWAARYGAEIDWPLLLDQCRSTHTELFAAAQFQIAQTYLGLELPLPDCWRCLDVDVEPMLLDMFDGGVYGAASLTRLHSSTVTLNTIQACRTGESPGLLRSVFPPRSYMAARYPYVRDHPVLLPAAWAGRILHYVSELGRTHDSSAVGSVRLARQRVALLQQYGVLR